MSIRKTLFWVHLAAGIVAGSVIAIMSFTGAVLSFEEGLVAWAEREVRRIPVPAELPPRIPLDALRQRAQAELGDAKANFSITVHRDPSLATVFNAGREGTRYANPYTGEIRRPATQRMRSFMHAMTDWHRWLALPEKHRDLGRAINGAANVAFVLLCLTGIVLWWPRAWTLPAIRAVSMPALRISGKARDFNWHNSLGLWSLPVLLVLSVTALPISYPWARNLIFQAVGEAVPGASRNSGAPTSSARPEAQGPGVEPVPLDLILQRIQAAYPGWNQIGLRQGGGRRREGGAEGQSQGPQPLMITVREERPWPRTASTSLTVHPVTGEVLRATAFQDLSRGQRIRSWMRFLHTGQALGWWGQLLAGVASVMALVLVYTGIALTWRRFFGPRTAPEKLTP